MADEKYTFEAARIRLEEIAAEVRKKDTSLEKSLDLLEEGVRLANICTELVDHTDVGATVVAPAPETGVSEDDAESAAGESDAPGDEAPEDAAPAGDAGSTDSDGFDEADDEVEELSDEDAED